MTKKDKVIFPEGVWEYKQAKKAVRREASKIEERLNDKLNQGAISVKAMVFEREHYIRFYFVHEGTRVSKVVPFDTYKKLCVGSCEWLDHILEVMLRAWTVEYFLENSL